jgi:hypothetical protein
MQAWLWQDPTQSPPLPPFEENDPDHVMRIWPGSPGVQEWPPARPFRDIGLWRYFGRNDHEIQRTIALLTQSNDEPAIGPGP